jgi:hypothetical protein
LQTRIGELQLINQSLRDNGKVKEDALAHQINYWFQVREIQHLEKKTTDIII